MSLRELGQVTGGLLPDAPWMRDEDARERPLHARSFWRAYLGDAPIRRVARILTQPKFPNCAGQGAAAELDARLVAARAADPRTGGQLWASGTSLWREARRRRWGVVGMRDIEMGSYIRDILEGLVDRGWDPWLAGEDTDDEEAGLTAPVAGDDLRDELFAHDKRGKGMARWRITETGSDRCDAMESVLADPNLALEFGSGCRDGFFKLRPHPELPDVVVSSAERGGGSNGHAERVFGVTREAGQRIWFVQGSWSIGFAGCHLPDGSYQTGCYRCDDSVFVDAWDIHAWEPVI